MIRVQFLAIILLSTFSKTIQIDISNSTKEANVISNTILNNLLVTSQFNPILRKPMPPMGLSTYKPNNTAKFLYKKMKMFVSLALLILYIIYKCKF